jgi:intracellular septation protein A
MAALSTRAPMPARPLTATLLSMATASRMQTQGVDKVNVRRAAAAVGRRVIHPSLLLNLVAPVAAYQVLTGHGASELNALLVAALFPLASVAISAVRHRRLDAIGGVSLAAIVTGAVFGLAFHDARLVLLKDSMITGTLGLVFLGSAVVRHPIAGIALRRLGQSAAEQAGLLTVVWGAAMTMEASSRVALSFTVAPGVLLAVSPLLAAAVFGPLGVWTAYRIAIGRRSRPA